MDQILQPTWWHRWLVISDLTWYLRSAIEICLLAVVIYYLLLALDRIAAGGKIKGIALTLAGVVGLWMLARLFQLHAISWLLQASIGFSALILIVIFQPELRRLFSRLGRFFPGSSEPTGAAALPYLVEAVDYLSERRIGALIVIERGDRLDGYIATSPLDCELTTKSLIALFWKDSPLHDGAVVVRGGRIAGAGVILPLTDSPEHKALSGTRHRAAVGISEDTDALAIVVSEESGAISIADKGTLMRNLSRQDVEILLGRVFRAAQAARPHEAASPTSTASTQAKP
jgi:diadenylate cyclase